MPKSGSDDDTPVSGATPAMDDESAVSSIAGKIGCTAQTLNEWVKRFERDSGVRAGVPSKVAERLKALERENRDLRQVNEILRKASAYFAQAELDRRFKP